MEYIELSYACIMDGDWISQEVDDGADDDDDDDDADDSVLCEVDVSLQTSLQTSLLVILHVIYKNYTVIINQKNQTHFITLLYIMLVKR